MRPPGLALAPILALALALPARAFDLGPRSLSTDSLSPPVTNLLLVALTTSFSILVLTLLRTRPLPRAPLALLATLSSLYILLLLAQFSSDVSTALRAAAPPTTPSPPLARVYAVAFDIPPARATGLAVPAASLACATCVMLLILPVILVAPGTSARKLLLAARDASHTSTNTPRPRPSTPLIALGATTLIVFIAALAAAAHVVRRVGAVDARVPGGRVRPEDLLPGVKGFVSSRPRLMRMQEFQEAVCGQPDPYADGMEGGDGEGGGQGQGQGGDGPGAAASGAPAPPEDEDGPPGGTAGVVRQFTAESGFGVEAPPRVMGIVNCTGVPPPYEDLDDCVIARADTSAGLASCLSGEDAAGQPVAGIQPILALFVDDVVDGYGANENGGRRSERAAAAFAVIVIVTGVITPVAWLVLFALVGMPTVLTFWAVGAVLLVPLCLTLFVVEQNIGTAPIHEIASVFEPDNTARTLSNDPLSVYIVGGPGLVTRELLHISGAALVAIMVPLLVAALTDPGNAIHTATALLQKLSFSGRQNRPARYPREQLDDGATP